jgi:hypothetical protein
MTIKQSTKDKHQHIASYALSHPDDTLQQISINVGLSPSQINEYLSSIGIRKERGVGGKWKQTDIIKIREYKYIPKPLPHKKRGKEALPVEIIRLHRTYHSMKQRCLNPNIKNYKYYGGRGITIHERWLGEDGLQHFIEDMGFIPPGVHESGRTKYTLERKNNDLGYSKENCIWATYKEQNDNQRNQTRGSKFSFAIAQEIRVLSKQGIPNFELARRYNTSRPMISLIVNNKIWKE